MKIKVGYLLSYDYSMFLTSVMQVYDNVDKIVVGIDEDYLTWSGNKFEISKEFFAEVKKIDTRNIIELYFDKFFIPGLSLMECESRERNMVLQKLGKGWKIQLDVDEYIYDFNSLAKFLKKHWYLTLFPNFTPICFSGILITLFKKLEKGFVFIDNEESFPFVTNQNYNTRARINSKIWIYQSNCKVLHQSWARSEEEIEQKIKNWGHRDDFDTSIYYDFWKNIDKENYEKIRNFHPLSAEVWNKLSHIDANDINEVIANFSREKKQEINSFDIISYFKSIIYMIIFKR